MIDSKTLVDKIVEACQEKKANDITILDLRDLSGSICDFFVICDGTSNIQISAIAEEVEKFVRKECKDKPISVNGMTESRWVGIDYGNVIVHIMLPEVRDFFSLEKLWSEAKIEKIPNLN